MLVFFEIEYGPRDVATAECQLTFALIMFKTGNVMGCLEYLQKCQINFQETVGHTAPKTKEVDHLIRRVEMLIKES